MRSNYLKLFVVVCAIMQLFIAQPAVLAAESTDPQVLDSDGDGVTDDIDQCPNTPKGVLVDLRNGCWAYSLSGAQFDSDSYKIKPKAHPMLNEVVEAMKRYPEFKIEIQGHTDNVGSAAYNMKLSENRAKKDIKGRMKLHADIAHPINAECRRKIQEKVISAFKEEVEQSKQPGYKPVEMDEPDNDVPEVVS